MRQTDNDLILRVGGFADPVPIRGRQFCPNERAFFIIPGGFMEMAAWRLN
jgi:hypothetical protein